LPLRNISYQHKPNELVNFHNLLAQQVVDIFYIIFSTHTLTIHCQNQREYSDLSATQIWDWLKKHVPEIEVGGGNTVRSHIRTLRKMYRTPKEVQQRQY